MQCCRSKQSGACAYSKNKTSEKIVWKLKLSVHRQQPARPTAAAVIKTTCVFFCLLFSKWMSSIVGVVQCIQPTINIQPTLRAWVCIKLWKLTTTTIIPSQTKLVKIYTAKRKSKKTTQMGIQKYTSEKIENKKNNNNKWMKYNLKVSVWCLICDQLQQPPPASISFQTN